MDTPYNSSNAQESAFQLPEISLPGCLLMLDVDGTLLDIAPRPDAVGVPLALKEALLKLHEITSGALVLISGRPIRDLDTLFFPLRLPAVGLHGGEVRLERGRPRIARQPSQKTLEDISWRALEFARQHSGILVETKPVSVALHFRMNPEAGTIACQFAEALVAEHGKDWMVLHGKQMCEIKPSFFSKEQMLHKLCAMERFAGRKPLYAGDDITDAAALREVQRMGGYAIAVGSAVEGAYQASSPAQMRKWLSSLATQFNPIRHYEPLRQTAPRKKPSLASRIIIISNRVSLPRASKANAGGLAVAMNGVLQNRGGIWMGWSGKTNDSPQLRSSTHGDVTYLLQDMTREDYELFYLSYCNGILWPLLHYNIGLTDFSWPAYEAYKNVNQQFARHLKDCAQPSDPIWVHDFHFIPLAYYLRELGMKNRIGFFLHTPFPSKEVLLTLPVHKEMMEHLSAYDVVGFQTRRDLQSFQEYASPDTAIANYGARDTFFGHFPISIETERFACASRKAMRSKELEALKASLGERRLILGVDRLDYSKGILQRMKAIEEVLGMHSEWHGKFSFMQIAPPTREEVQQYAQLRSEVESLVGHINGKFTTLDWVPIRFLARGIRRELIAAFYRLARICLVTPLRDGMNLVAKEFIAAQDPLDPGVLILSRFAGAAEELQQALLVNPYDIQEMAGAILQALAMPLAERQERWQSMFDTISRQTLTKWHEDFLSALTGY